MGTHARASLRAAVTAACATALDTATWDKPWWRKVNPSDLPLGGVATPMERPVRVSGRSVARAVDLVVMLKIADVGDATDALLDAHSVTLERAVIPVLAGVSDDFDLVECETALKSESGETIGELALRFRVVLKTPEGTPDPT